MNTVTMCKVSKDFSPVILADKVVYVRKSELADKKDATKCEAFELSSEAVKALTVDVMIKDVKKSMSAVRELTEKNSKSGFLPAFMYCAESGSVAGNGAVGGSGDKVEALKPFMSAVGVSDDVVIFSNGGDSGLYAITRGALATWLTVGWAIRDLAAGKGIKEIKPGPVTGWTVLSAPVKVTGKKATEKVESNDDELYC